MGARSMRVAALGAALVLLLPGSLADVYMHVSAPGPRGATKRCPLRSSL